MPDKNAPSAPLDPALLAAFGDLCEKKQPRNLEELRALLAGAQEAAATPDYSAEDLELIRVYNKTPKQYRHGDHLAAPHAFTSVPRWLAKKWVAMFPDEIVSGDDAQKTVDGSNAALQAANAKAEALETEKAALADELEQTKAALAKLKKDIGD